jgi:protocatechuate 3,4-dioxygenase beta subunit
MTTILLPLFLMTLAGTLSQQPRDGARPAATGTSRLSGVVVTGERSPQPVRRAIVTISGSALGLSRSTITDDGGRFTFDALPAGRFTVTAARRAYLTSAFGAAYPGDAGTAITVGEAAQVDDVRITLWKGAVLTGAIVDASGTPIPSVAVTVFRVTESDYATAGEDVTNDRGVYRVYGLPPGDYIVVAAPRPAGVGDMGVRSEREVDAHVRLLAGLLPWHSEGGRSREDHGHARGGTQRSRLHRCSRPDGDGHGRRDRLGRPARA